ncbi:cysteine desulfurase family protein [Tuanshanicoccus lijuaniae]|uniref:cysteine desulfurase family protein n=1 Tax=Aerococcaceae bacterium zg-1292 TaxID=2774330 RepID=UPI001BD810A2|nr:cysteine desulfurase [Aerococcaceae bacterium zg-BR9]MBS4456515.1 cysteine desulfurase [Aerococcaceae bacterium zg-A91]MBS4458616.1 cysteine desulfurase [Aerococcaceae bacterium zg-BR33]
MIYLDYAATTPVDKRVSERIHQVLTTEFANPSSVYQAGKHQKHQLNQARNQLKQLLNAVDYDAYFTSGATESNNWAILSQAMKARSLNLGNHIVATAVEHPSVNSVLAYLETQGFEVTYLAPKKERFSAEQFIQASRKETIGWVAMWVNNELGTRLPIEAIGAAAREYVHWFHVDAVQALGYSMVDLSTIAVTSLSGSGHKFYAPKGIGFLLYQPWNPALTLSPLLHGGGQESGLRSGTENVPYILGMVHALELTKESDWQHSQDLSDYLFERLNALKIPYQRNGKDTVPYIISLYFSDLLASQLLIQLDLAGIAVSAGSACSAGSLEVSHVLKAYYPNEEVRHHQTIRISLGRDTTKADINALVETINELQERKQTLWHSQQKQL